MSRTGYSPDPKHHNSSANSGLLHNASRSSIETQRIQAPHEDFILFDRQYHQQPSIHSLIHAVNTHNKSFEDLEEEGNSSQSALNNLILSNTNGSLQSQQQMGPPPQPIQQFQFNIYGEVIEQRLQRVARAMQEIEAMTALTFVSAQISSHRPSDQEQPLTARLQPWGIDQIVEILEDTTFRLNISMRQFVEINQTQEKMSLNNNKHVHTSTLDSLPNDISFRNHYFQNQDTHLLESLKDSLKAKDRELQSLAHSLKSKKELESRIIKISAQLTAKDDEALNLKSLLTKAQDVIVKLSTQLDSQRALNNHQEPPPQYVDTDREQSCDLELIEAMRGELNEMMSEHIESKKIQWDKKVEEIEIQTENRIRKEYEDKVLEVQRKSEDIIRYYRNELAKFPPGGQMGLGYTQGALSSLKDSSLMKLNQNGQFNITMKKETLGNSSTGAVKFNNTFSKLPEDTKNMSVTAQIAFEAYCDSIEEIKELKSIINSMTANQEAQVSSFTTKFEELNSEFLSKLEQAHKNQAENVGKLNEKDKELKILKELVFEMKGQALEAQKYIKELVSYVGYQRESQMLRSDQGKIDQTFMKHTITDMTSMSHTFNQESTKGIRELQHQTEFQNSLIKKLQAEVDLEKEKIYQHRLQIERSEAVINQTREDKSTAEFRLNAVKERIKEIWQTQCDHYLYDTNAISAVVDQYTQCMGWIDFIAAELNETKLKNTQQKEYQYELLQQISNLTDLRESKSFKVQQQSTNRTPFLANESFGGGENNYNSGGAAVNISKNQVLISNSQLTFKQLKRNELCEMLREEVRQLQEDQASKNELIITLKRQIELDQDAFLEKQADLNQKQNQIKNLEQIRDQLLFEKAEITHLNTTLRQTLTEKCQDIDYLTQKAKQDHQSTLVRKEQLFQENKELKDLRDDLRREKTEVESRLESANDRIEEVKRREREMIEQCSRLKLRLQEKERQNEQLRKETERFIEKHSQLEAQVDSQKPLMKPACIQTDLPEEHVMINLTNDKLKRDLDQALADVNSLLDSYEARKEENLSLRSKLTDFESEIHRLESLCLKHSNDLDNEKQTVEKLVQKEKQRIDKKRKRKIVKALMNEEDLKLKMNEEVALQVEEIQTVQKIKTMSRSNSVKRNAESQTELLQRPKKRVVRSKSKNRRIQTLQVEEKGTDRSDGNLTIIQDRFYTQDSRTTLKNPHLSVAKSRNNHQVYSSNQHLVFTTQDSKQQLLPRINTANNFYHHQPFQTLSNNKENLTMNSNQDQLPYQQMMNATIDQIRQEANIKYKKKLKKRIKCIEIFLQNLAGQTVDEEAINRGTVYMQNKMPQILHMIELIMQGFINLHQVQYQPYLKLAQQVTKCVRVDNSQLIEQLLQLENLMIQNNRQDTVLAMDNFTQQLAFTLETQHSTIQSVSSQKHIIIQDSIIEHQSTDEMQPMLSPVQEKTFASKLSKIEHKLKQKVMTLEKLLEYLTLQRALIKSQDLISLSGKDLSIFFTHMTELQSQMKLELSFDQLMIAQLLKSLPDSTNHQLSRSTANEEHSEEDKIYQQALKLMQFSFQNSQVDPSTFRYLQNPAQLAIDQGQSLKQIIAVFDKQYVDTVKNEQMAQSIPNFVDRMIHRIRKQATLTQNQFSTTSDRSNVSLISSNRYKALQSEVEDYIAQNSKQSFPSLKVLQEYLELRLLIFRC